MCPYALDSPRWEAGVATVVASYTGKCTFVPVELHTKVGIIPTVGHLAVVPRIRQNRGGVGGS